MPKIEVKNVYKIFGTEPSKVLPMCQEGATKEDILENTGHTVGLADVSLSIEEGETFVSAGEVRQDQKEILDDLHEDMDNLPEAEEDDIQFQDNEMRVSIR
jgi:glycine betaine/proline transport system ATP-binding protein